MRRFERLIDYNGKNISKDVAGMVTSLTYSESVTGEADSISISICNRDLRWLNAWMPVDGDRVSVKIKLIDWMKKDDNSVMNLGQFYLDAPKYSGPPSLVSLEGVSRKTNDGFAKTKRTKTWSQGSIKTICQKICDEYGLKLYFDAEDFGLPHTEQDDTDMAFTYGITSKYGLRMKVFQDKMIILDPERYELIDPIMKIERTAGILTAWSLDVDRNESSFTSCEINYQSSESGNSIVYKYSLPDDTGSTLVLDEAVTSVQEAERLTKVALRNSLRKKITGSLTLMGMPDLISSQNIELRGFGLLDGIYSIEKSTHDFSSKYETSIDIYKIDASIGTGGEKNNAKVSPERESYRDQLSDWADKGVIR